MRRYCPLLLELLIERYLRQTGLKGLGASYDAILEYIYYLRLNNPLVTAEAIVRIANEHYRTLAQDLVDGVSKVQDLATTSLVLRPADFPDTLASMLADNVEYHWGSARRQVV